MEMTKYASSETCTVSAEKAQNGDSQDRTARDNSSEGDFRPTTTVGHFPDINDDPRAAHGSAIQIHHRSLKFVEQLVLLFVVNCLVNGILPSLQSFACLPYGRLVYTLAVRISAISGPVACFIALLWSANRKVKMIVLTVLGVILSGYQIGMAGMSPHPLWQDNAAGKTLMVSVNTLDSFVISEVC